MGFECIRLHLKNTYVIQQILPLTTAPQKFNFGDMAGDTDAQSQIKQMTLHISLQSSNVIPISVGQ